MFGKHFLGGLKNERFLSVFALFLSKFKWFYKMSVPSSPTSGAIPVIMAPPVPIPNTEVKLVYGESS